jgi:hypothetical protein
MAAIRPFRHLIVYPPVMKQIEQAWRASTPVTAASAASRGRAAPG